MNGFKPPVFQPPAPKVEAQTAVVKKEAAPVETLEGVKDISAFYDLIVNGNLDKLTKDQQVIYYNRVCDSLCLNPAIRPFAFIKLDGKLTLYALKEAATQLARRDHVSLEVRRTEIIEKFGIATCEVRASDPSGRFTDEAASIPWGANLKGDAAANQWMKLITKGKRRAVLSHCGLGMLDESELETIPAAKVQAHEPAPKEIPKPIEPPKPAVAPTPAPAVAPAPAVDAEVIVENGFDYNSTSDRQWLIDVIKTKLPAVKREDIIAIAQTFCQATDRTDVVGCLDKRVEIEKARKAKGEPCLL